MDSSAITLTENTVQNNAFAGVLIDLARWDDAERGVAQLTITDTTSAGNNQGTGRDVVLQNIPDTAQVTITNSGEEATLVAGEASAWTEPRRRRHAAATAASTPARSATPPRLKLAWPARIAARSSPALLVSQRLATICAPSIRRTGSIASVRRWRPQPASTGPMRQGRWLSSHRSTSGPANPRRPYAQIASGAQHSCALTAITDAQPIAAVYCWGSNTRDQLGTGLSDTNDPSVVTIPDEAVDNPVVSVHAGAHHSCARRQQGQVYCWGQNTLGAGSGRHDRFSARCSDPTAADHSRRRPTHHQTILDRGWRQLRSSDGQRPTRSATLCLLGCRAFGPPRRTSRCLSPQPGPRRH